MLSGFALLILCGGLGLWWYYHRAIPEPVTQRLRPGVEYERFVLPELAIGHLIWIDLTQPGLAFLVTPPSSNGEHVLSAKTTSAFLEEYDLDFAINGDYFTPWHSHGPFDYYPHAGDGVNVYGVAASQGEIYSKGGRERPSFLSGQSTVYISQSNVVSFDQPTGPIFNAISGGQRIITQGQISLTANSLAELDRHPRTVIGTDKTGKKMGWLVIDGRQPNYSKGLTLSELATSLVEHEFFNAVVLDGGGSSVLVTKTAKGNAIRLNSPINFRIPFIERNVANHLGVWLQKRNSNTDSVPDPAPSN